ncbi:hypothetical protein M9H77_30102 [Catharanthus roseus]|uniref:Uncharacterized protein n=1 Tax=Catharanthus roseus TaxID=4058 RepID=A0ACB9ZWB2_CATRO|nr:hypothetical protein M9H77_30102 [Catharanthus roseus]
MVQAIKDWLISKSAFEEGSFYGFTSFYKKFIKDLSTIASLLIDVLEKKTGVTWQISHALRLDGKTNLKLIKYIHSKNHDVVHANNKKFGMQHFVFDPRGTLKNKLEEFEDPRKASRLSICPISKGQSREQIGDLPYRHRQASAGKALGRWYPTTSEFPFFESIDLRSSNCVIGVIRPLFPQGSS